jgi:hypothetical protein
MVALSFERQSEQAMTLSEYSLSAFAVLNTARIIAYFPQAMRIYVDVNGAKAVSIATWSLFSAANLATVSYALTVVEDPLVATVFSLNTIGCLVIVGFTIWKRIEAGHWGLFAKGGK